MALDSARGILNFGTRGTGGRVEKAGRIGRAGTSETGGRIGTGETSETGRMSGTGGTSETGETGGTSGTGETSGVFFCFCSLSFVICNYFVSLSLENYN